MDCDRAEAAFSIASAMGGDRETNGLQGFHFSLPAIKWVEIPLILQVVYRVEFRT
jgi:hypothetical protein